MDKLKLMKTANEVRKGIVTSVHSAKAGHPGGSLSAADLFTYLYFEELNVDPKDPKKDGQRSFRPLKGTYSAGALCRVGRERIFPERRSDHTETYRFLSSGSSGYEVHSGC